ncbi:flagellar motor stator protein MotA [Endozoicomonas ascidiicola]|uniref:flagellar motor stator protein MotA n=1 Tax=Endozoicomonas ascidiicola TaxID=1698521 RepID=UPI000836B553|nr:flagellar motor stator protein MotA [Endozoicomonas ascidiicola]
MKTIGLLILLGSIFGGFLIAGGEMAAIWQPAEILMIAGGAFGAFLIANPMVIVKATGRHLMYMAKGTGFNRAYFDELLSLMYALFEMARKKGGNKILEEHIESPDTSDVFKKYPLVLKTPHIYGFIVENLRLSLVDGVTPKEYEHLIEQEIGSREHEMMRPAMALQTVADALPGFGILAAVLGIVITMASINGPMDQIGASIAAALTGTFLGVFFAYGLVAPAATAIGHSTNDELQAFDCIKVALASYKSGFPPIVAVDSGRKILYGDCRPTSTELEKMLENQGG